MKLSVGQTLKNKDGSEVTVMVPPIHTHYNEELQQRELCERVVCPYGFIGSSFCEEAEEKALKIKEILNS